MIECRGVSFSYDGAALALDGIDLNIEDGEFFCILGGNGSGKSTFAKHLNALLQPDTGTVCVNGMDASDPELVYDIRSTAGMVFQNPDDQLVATLVEDDVAFGPENLGVESAQIAQRVREADMVADIVQAYAERSRTGIAGRPFASDHRIPDSVSSAIDGADALEPVIEISHLSYSYSLSARERRRWHKRSAAAGKSNKQALWGNDPSSPWALRDVSLTVRRGEFLGLAGHTGSGKSTLVQHLNGLIRPQEGSVRALGLNLSNKKDAAAVKAKVGVVFQYPERQLFAETVTQDVAFGPRNLGLSQAEVARRVESSLARVGLDLATVGDKSPFELSGGQQRRVAFAGVLAMEPEVLVLDEPMAGLDPAARSDFLELIDRLHHGGLTVVMVSHSMDDLANCCDRIVVMNEGTVFVEGTPAQVFAQADELKSIGLGVPAAQRMALALAKADVPLRFDGLYTVESLTDELVDLLIGRSDGPSNVADIAKSKTVAREEGC